MFAYNKWKHEKGEEKGIVDIDIEYFILGWISNYRSINKLTANDVTWWKYLQIVGGVYYAHGVFVMN